MFTLYSPDGVACTVGQDQVQLMLDAGYTMEQKPDQILTMLEASVADPAPVEIAAPEPETASATGKKGK
jgi:hypothetical protein